MASCILPGGRSTTYNNIQQSSLPYNNGGPRALDLLPELVADLDQWCRLVKLELLYLLPALVHNV